MNSERIQQWLAECPAGPPIVPIAPPGRAEIENAIRCSPSTAPGRDGVPFACRRGIGQLGVDVFAEVLGCLCAEGGEAALADMGLDEEGRHPYSEGPLVLLPKKPAGADPAAFSTLNRRALARSTSLTPITVSWPMPSGTGLKPPSLRR